MSEKHCRNTDGYYECFCPDGQSGNGTLADGCHKQDLTTKVAIGSSAGLILLFLVISILHLTYHKRKLIKLKQKFFQQNGGSILLQQLSAREDSSQSAQIFTEEELKKATKNYDESLIIGRGGFGTVFKGILPDDKIVAVKKSKVIDANINEVFCFGEFRSSRHARAERVSVSKRCNSLSELLLARASVTGHDNTPGRAPERVRPVLTAFTRHQLARASPES
ncbi:putative wall-associated receptor kinase [Trifolium repens]|nr:putative wall-associated receptor kinase [Trifolium repens]